MSRYCAVTCQCFIGAIRPFVITDEEIFRARTKVCPVILECGFSKANDFSGSSRKAGGN